MPTPIDPKTLDPKTRDKIVSALKRVWRNSPQRKAVHTRCQHPTDKKLRICEACFAVVHYKLFEIDHIEAIGGIVIGCKGDWSLFIARLFLLPLQGLCPECHKPKTSEDKALAKGKGKVGGPKRV